MKEPNAKLIGDTIIKLLEIESWIIKGWNIPKATIKLVNELKDDLIFQHQFLK